MGKTTQPVDNPLEAGVFHYSEVLIDHAQNPRNMELPESYNGFAINDGFCGDMMSMWILVEEGIIQKVGFNTNGCGPSIACGSIAVEMAKGKTIYEIREITLSKIIETLQGLQPDHEHCASLAAATFTPI